MCNFQFQFYLNLPSTLHGSVMIKESCGEVLTSEPNDTTKLKT